MILSQLLAYFVDGRQRRNYSAAVDSNTLLAFNARPVLFRTSHPRIRHDGLETPRSSPRIARATSQPPHPQS
jgi:hypothetical protein